MARAGEGRKMTRVIFEFLRFQTVKQCGSVGQRIGFGSLKSRAWVRSLPRPVLFLFPNYAYFPIFSYFLFVLIFYLILILFIILFLHLKNTKNIFFFYIIFTKTFI